MPTEVIQSSKSERPISEQVRSSAGVAARPTVSDSFGLLPQPSGRFGSFTISATANIAISALLIWFAIMELHKRPPAPRYESVSLIFPTTPPPPLPPVPHIKVIPPPVVVETPPKIQVPKAQVLPEPPKPAVVKLNTPPLPAIPPAPPKMIAPPPQPKVGVFASSKPTAVANSQTAPTVKTGGFGDPTGVAPNPNANRPANVATVGAFNAAPGVDQGAGASHRGVVQAAGFGSGAVNGAPGGTSRATVASAGFGSGVAGGTPGGTGKTRGSIATGGFGNNVIGGNGAPVAKAAQVSFVAPEILSEPRPQYTDEARQLKVQGEVTLQVRFGANGRVEVLRIVSGLGHGLDEQARRVAEQIRFKPATANGLATDHVTLIHILFQLA